MSRRKLLGLIYFQNFIGHNLCSMIIKIFMEKSSQPLSDIDTRTFDYDEPNDRSTYMTDMMNCMNILDKEGFTDQYKVEKGRLHDFNNNKNYKPRQVRAVDFYRFEGMTDPDDMAILYAIETYDGRRGTLADAYGYYSDGATGNFMLTVEIHKITNKSYNPPKG
jgi:hypothetical protein